MYRIVPPSCGVCGSNAAYQMESFEVTLCYQCARAAVEWLYLNQSLHNIFGVDLVTGISDHQLDSREGKMWRVWIRSEDRNNSFTGVMVHFDSKLLP